MTDEAANAATLAHSPTLAHYHIPHISTLKKVMVLGHSRYRPKGCSEGCAKWRVRGL